MSTSAKSNPRCATWSHDLLTLEATGDYAGAKHLMDTLGVIRPEEQKTIDSLKDVPVDIAPVFVTATSLAGAFQP